jgi:hypothetical protein
MCKFLVQRTYYHFIVFILFYFFLYRTYFLSGDSEYIIFVGNITSFRLSSMFDFKGFRRYICDLCLEFHTFNPTAVVVPQLRWLVDGFQARRSVFVPRSGHVGYVVDKVARG